MANVISIDVRDLDEWDKDILHMINETLPNETKKFMRRQGGRLATVERRLARKEIKKHPDYWTNKDRTPGSYFKSIQGTRSWQSKNGFGVKAISKRPPGYHSHLLEYGHRIFIRGQYIGKSTRAFKIQARGLRDYEPLFQSRTKEFIEQMMEKGLGN